MKRLPHSLLVVVGSALVANTQVQVGSNPTTIDANSLPEMESGNKGTRIGLHKLHSYGYRWC